MCEKNILHTVLISFREPTPEADRQRMFERLQNLGRECGGKEAGILMWNVEWNLDTRKSVHIMEVAVFRDHAALDALRAHPKHKELTGALREIADWSVGDMPIQIEPASAPWDF